MYKSGHLGLSLSLYSPVLFALLTFNEYLLAFTGLFITMFCASLPDLDLKIPFIKHRGYSHTVVGAVFMGSIIAIGTFVSYIYISGIIAMFGMEIQYSAHMFSLIGGVFGFYGVMTHYAGDIVTPMGLKPLAPFSRKKYTLDLFYAKNRIANGGSLLLGFFITGSVIAYHVYTVAIV